MTQLENARKGKVTPLLKRIARQESLSQEILLERVSDGSVVLPLNKARKIDRHCGIGKGLKTKINANIGTSPDFCSLGEELKKMRTAISCGADTIMDLSTGGALRKIRRRLIKESNVPFGTVPVYEIAVKAIRRKGSIRKIDSKDILTVLEEQAADGVDFFTIHAGLTRKALKALRDDGRVMDIVSRGGAFIADWIIANKSENPFYEHFDDILKIAHRWDITLSLGDGLRPGSIMDATDRAQIEELATLGELARRANERGVQVIIEGPGHVPLNQIETNIRLEKELCDGRPFYVLGPLVTDVAPGYDHIVGAIGGAVAAGYGADYLCYVTPSEHLRLPSVEDVKDGVMASRIAAHAADIAKGLGDSSSWDKKLSEARRKRDWPKQISLAIDPKLAGALRGKARPKKADACTMCSNFCSIDLSEKALAQLKEGGE